MAKIKLNGDTSGYIEISAPAVSGNNTLELGPGTKILTNLDNTFTGITTFSNGIHITSGGFILNQQRSDTHTSLIIDKPDAGTGTLKFFNNGSASAYIQHTGAEHLDYYLPSGSGYHAFYTNGSERLRISSAGKLTVTPADTTSSYATTDGGIDIAQTIISTGTSNSQSIGIQFSLTKSGQTGAISEIGAIREGSGLSGLVFRTRDNSTGRNERLRITSAGKVGINTVSPRAVLDIEGNAENFTLFLHSNDANANLQFSDNSGGARILNYGGDLAFRTGTNAHSFGSGDNEALRITSDGKLGIKVASPGCQTGGIHAVHDATQGTPSFTGAEVGIFQRNYNGAQDCAISIVSGNNASSTINFGDKDDVNPGIIEYMNGSNAMRFSTNAAERLRIASDGRITHTGKNGAAASTAIDPLSSFVLDDAEARLQLCATNGGSNAAAVILSNESKHWVVHQRGPNASNHFDIGYYDSASPSDINQQATPYFRITKEGRVTLPQQPRFFAWGNNSINMTSTGYHTWTTFTNTRFNVGNHFSTSTKLFTAPIAGTYLFGCNCRVDAGGVGYFRIILSINGSSADNDQGHSIRNADAGNAFYHSQEVTAMYQLSANDNVRVLVESNSDSSWTMQSESQFWGYLVA